MYVYMGELWEDKKDITTVQWNEPPIGYNRNPWDNLKSPYYFKGSLVHFSIFFLHTCIQCRWDKNYIGNDKEVYKRVKSQLIVLPVV